MKQTQLTLNSPPHYAISHKIPTKMCTPHREKPIFLDDQIKRSEIYWEAESRYLLSTVSVWLVDANGNNTSGGMRE